MSDLSIQLTQFLETYPLLRKLRFAKPFPDEFDGPSLHVHCPVCKREQTFRMGKEVRHHGLQRRITGPFGPDLTSTIWGDVLEVRYLCAACHSFLRSYYLEVSTDGLWLRKLGQHPPWEIIPDKDLEPLLGEHAETYKNGLVCESQGYGIGAFAYYRRVVESFTDELLRCIEDLLQGEDRRKYHDALKATQSAQSASDKFELVKEYLPPVLRPGGADPLGRIYGFLSEGLHSLPDEDCLELAAEVRTCLEYVVRQVVGNKRSEAQFTAGMAKILSRHKDGKRE